MKVRLNDDPEIVRTIREGLKRTGGYCPCRLARTEENKCMCKEFKVVERLADELRQDTVPAAGAVVRRSLGGTALPRKTLVQSSRFDDFFRHE